MTDTKTEARAIALDVYNDAVDSDDGSHSMDMNVATDIIATALAAKDEKIQALNDECQQSMLDIARERDRAERAEAQLAEITEGSRQEFAANMGPMRAYLLQTDHTRLMAENGNLRAQLAETRKALEALDRMSRGVDWCDQDEQARRWSAARRALEAQGGDDVL